MTWSDFGSRGKISTIWVCTYNLGGIFYLNIFYQNAKLGYDWRYGFYYNGVISIINGLLMFYFVEPEPNKVGITIDRGEEVNKALEDNGNEPK